MKKQLQGIAILLFSLLMTLGSAAVGWRFVFDLDLQWQHIFMVLGAVGLLVALLPDKKDK